MYLFSIEPDKLSIECDGCNKVYLFRKQYFSYICPDYCVNNTTLQCPNCKNIVQPNTRIEAKQTMSTSNNYVVRCPHCGSTQIQLVPHKWSLLSGFLTNKVDRVCVKCKSRF